MGENHLGRLSRCLDWRCLADPKWNVVCVRNLAEGFRICRTKSTSWVFKYNSAAFNLKRLFMVDHAYLTLYVEAVPVQLRNFVSELVNDSK